MLEQFPEDGLRLGAGPSSLDLIRRPSRFCRSSTAGHRRAKLCSRSSVSVAAKRRAGGEERMLVEKGIGAHTQLRCCLLIIVEVGADVIQDLAEGLVSKLVAARREMG